MKEFTEIFWWILVSLIVAWILFQPLKQPQDKVNYPPAEATGLPCRIQMKKFQSILFVSKEAKGNSIFTHMGGRRELFNVEKVELMCIGGDVDDPESTWQLNAEVSNKWFVSHTLTGPVHIRFNFGQLIHCSEYWQKSEDFSSDKNAEGFWQEFHSADIAFKNKKPVSVAYRHMQFRDGEWTEAASYSAKFSETPLLKTYDGSPPQPLGQSK